MGKIYLQVPSLVAAFYRGKDLNRPLSHGDAYAFLPGTAEYQALLLGLRYIPVDEQIKAKCYTQYTWCTMMAGKDPRINTKVLDRDKNLWLTARDICFLLDKKYSDRQEIFDYLCIEIPKKIVVNEAVRNTNNNYGLDRSIAFSLRKMLVNGFYQVLAQWYYKNRELEEELSLKRSMVDFINRFLFAHGMPVTESKKEEFAIRKMVERGLAGHLILKDKMEAQAVSILKEIYSDEKIKKDSVQDEKK